MTNTLRPAAPLVALRATRAVWEEMVDLLPLRYGIRIQVQLLHCAAATLNVLFGGDDAAFVLDIADDFNLTVKEDTPANQIKRLRANAHLNADPLFTLALCDQWEADLLNRMVDETEVLTW